MEEEDEMRSFFWFVFIFLCFVILQQHGDLVSDVFSCEIRDLPVKNKKNKLGHRDHRDAFETVVTTKQGLKDTNVRHFELKINCLHATNCTDKENKNTDSSIDHFVTCKA